MPTASAKRLGAAGAALSAGFDFAGAIVAAGMDAMLGAPAFVSEADSGDVDAAALQRLESEAMERRTVVIARLETQRRPAVDAPIEVAVDTRRLHFFDLDNGIAIYDLT